METVPLSQDERSVAAAGGRVSQGQHGAQEGTGVLVLQAAKHLLRRVLLYNFAGLRAGFNIPPHVPGELNRSPTLVRLSYPLFSLG